MTTPATSKRESILANIKSVLTFTAGATYNYTMVSVERARLTPYEGMYPAAFIFEESDEPVEEFDSTCARKLTVTIEAWIEATSSISAAVNKLFRDLEVAIMTDRTRGGYAVDTRPPSARFILADGMPGGVLMTVDVIYQHPVATP